MHACRIKVLRRPVLSPFSFLVPPSTASSRQHHHHHHNNRTPSPQLQPPPARDISARIQSRKHSRVSSEYSLSSSGTGRATTASARSCTAHCTSSRGERAVSRPLPSYRQPPGVGKGLGGLQRQQVTWWLPACPCGCPLVASLTIYTTFQGQFLRTRFFKRGTGRGIIQQWCKKLHCTTHFFPQRASGQPLTTKLQATPGGGKGACYRAH